MNNDEIFGPISDTLTFLPLSISPEVMMALFWILAGITAVVSLVLIYHLSKYSISRVRATILITIQVGISALLLIIAYSAATLV